MGCYVTSDKKSLVLTKSAEAFNQKTSGELLKKLNVLSPPDKGKERTFYGITPEYPVISVVGLGPEDAGFNEEEAIDEERDNVRVATATGFKAIDRTGYKVELIEVDGCGDARSAAEGVYLASYKYDELKKKSEKEEAKPKAQFSLLDANPASTKDWERGRLLSEGQNIVRRLGSMPANMLTPELFVREVEKLVSGTSIKMTVYDKAWAESKNMGLLLSVAQGSDYPLRFLELEYKSSTVDSAPLVLVGKGITFDTGGISIKPAANMHLMKADMLGAANVVACIVVAAKLGLDVNLVGLTPLTENTINGKATKPGDVFTAANGKTVEVGNTDAEGRLVLADALCYADEFNPAAVIDMATLTGAMDISMGSQAFGVWCLKNSMWELIQSAGADSGERCWRLPVFSRYNKALSSETVSDLNNISTPRGQAGSNTAACFLRNFTKCANWTHLDIASVDWSSGDVAYLPKGAAGRPVRCLVQLTERFFQSPKVSI